MNITQNQLALGKPQQCSVSSLYVMWGAYVAGLAIFAGTASWVVFFLFLVLVPLGKSLQIRFYAQVSSLLGYGRIASDRLPAAVTVAPVEVTFYSALGCPFCPIVLERLRALQKQMCFRMQTINVTFNPQLARTRGIQSVPAVEVAGNRLIGNVTSEQLATLIGQPALVEHGALLAS